eukprot:2122661-Rhodomonas_salina.5
MAISIKFVLEASGSSRSSDNEEFVSNAYLPTLGHVGQKINIHCPAQAFVLRARGDLITLGRAVICFRWIATI